MAELRYNSQTGEAVLFDGQQWLPTETRHNQQGDAVAFDGNAWVPVGGNAPQSFAQRTEQLDPTSLSVARSKNDEFGAYLRAEAEKPVEGESDHERSVRQYGQLGGDVGNLEGVTRAYVQGGTMAGGDEGIAAIRAAKDSLTGNMPYGEAYDQRVSQERHKLNAYRNQNPVAAYGAEVAGAIPTSMLPILNAVKGGNYAKAAKTAGGQGGLYGVNSGDTLSDRLVKGGTGAVLGTVAGTAMVPVANAVSRGVNRLATNKVAKSQGMSGPAYSILQRNMMGDDSLTGAGAQRIADAGPDAMLADAGVNAQTLLDTAIQSGGAGARVANQRVQGRVNDAGGRLTRSLNEAMGQPGQSASKAVTIYGDKTNPISTLYKKAYSKPVDYASETGQKIEAIVRNRVPKSAIDAANALMRLKGEKSKQILIDVADDGSVVFRELPDVRQLDYITRGLNQVAKTEDGKGALGGTTPLGSANQSLSRELRNAVKKLVPEYKAALNAASDAIGSKNAREFGLTVLSQKTTRADVSEMIADMGDAEVTKVVEGVRMQLDDALARVSRTMTDGDTSSREAFKLIKDMSSRASREKVAMLLGDDVSNKLFREFDQAVKAFELRSSVAANSKTFTRTEADNAVKRQMDGGPLTALRDVHPVEAGRRIIQSMVGRSPEAKQGISDKVYGELVDALTRENPQEILRILQESPQLIDRLTRKTGDLGAKLAGRNAALLQGDHTPGKLQRQLRLK